jgi:proline racemase
MDPTAALNWNPPAEAMTIRTIDAHTEGEPFRVVVQGFPPLEGGTILEKRRFAMAHFDHLRTALMWEPRGHADMYGCLITEPVTSEADFGILFMHNGGFSTMCGHGIIGIATVAVETGMVPSDGPETTLRIDTPAGLVTAIAEVDAGGVRRVRFTNVPSFVAASDQAIDVPGLGTIRYDLAFGGAYYAFVDVDQVGLNCKPEATADLIQAGMAIKRAVMAQGPIDHPTDEDLGFLYGTIFIDRPSSPELHSRNVCIFAEGEVDRCPTGTGVSARLAIHHARGELDPGQVIEIESILGTRFRGKIVDTTQVDGTPAIIPEVSGTAHITGRNTFIIQPDDPLRDGFVLR